ncbi:hypothetical protein HPB49_018269 [Dermacentor silvarum]|uniref:Uncharacterized protein n=1 Tax=Dermacentor silvarum TaxID=543639 RepID=A0ACB8DEU5_DERSI|nr:hypothetical protein HPB49_018269 [Dermacentor silvarum]
MASVAITMGEDAPMPEVRQAMWDMRCSGTLCDGLIKTVDGGEFAVHKVVMASCSEYFRALFGCRLSKAARSDVLVPGVLKATMAIIVEFAYKRITWVGCDNVESLLEAADYLCVMGMVKDCGDFLLSIMTPENCISIHNVAKLYNCFDLSTKAYKYLMRNFIEVSERSEELLHLEIDEVEAIMSDENLNVIKEETVWKAVIRWIEFDPENRKQYISRLFKCVRTGLVDTDFFVENVKACKYVAEDEACRPLVIDTLRFLYDLDVMVHNEEVPTPLFARPRIPHEMMFVIGGWMSGGPTAFTESYDTKADRWIKIDIADPLGPRAYHKCAVIGYEIYVIGGFNGEDYFSSVRCFNAETKEWRSVTPMHVKSGVGCVGLRDCIYAVGGFNGSARLCSAEKYNPETNIWTTLPNMNTPRSNFAVTVSGQS